MDELKVFVASEIKSEGLDNALPENSVEIIARKVIEKLNLSKSIKSIPEMVSEDLVGDNTSVISNDEAVSDVPVAVDSTNSLEYTPELPDFSKKLEPSQVFVFDMNELSEGGENMANKPFRTISNPDERKSMHDFWIKEGKTKADVYICKFERIGEIDFNYSNGTAQFVDNKFTDVKDLGVSNNGFVTNPYKSTENLELDSDNGNEINNLENYIKTAVDVEKVVTDTVTKLFNDFIQGKASAVTTPVGAPASQGIPAGAPISESKELNVKMSLLANDEDNYKKVDLPKELNECINKNDKKFLKNENEDVYEWNYDDKTYYTPKNRISKTKGYIKL